MYANFVVSGSAQDVHVHRDIQVQVHKELEPPYEELFDAVEEHVLHSLLEPWQLHLEQEKSVFDAEVRLKILIFASKLTASSYLNERIHSSTRYRLSGQLLFNWISPFRSQDLASIQNKCHPFSFYYHL